MAKLLTSFLPLHDVVCSLLEVPFCTWDENAQIDVVKNDRPQVTICANKRKADEDEARFQFFRRTWYFRYNWICGSTYYQNIHCWPCLLFASEADRWVCDLCYDDSDLDMFDKHAKEASHISCVKKLADFRRDKCKKVADSGKSLLEEVPKRISVSDEVSTNYAVRLNRQCTQFAVDAILFMVKKQMPLVEEGESSFCSHADLFHLLFHQAENDELKIHFRKMKGLVNPILTKTMLQGIVESVSECILEFIQATVKEANFFSLRIDDGLDESSECALFLRVVNLHNELKEFFIGSYSLGSDRTSLSLFRILDSLLEKYDYKSKLIGICFDITCVKFNYLKDLRVGMKFMAQQSTNVNLLGHSLDYLVEKCLSRVPTCRQFFANLSALFNLTKILVKRNYCPNSEDWREVCNLKNSCCSKFKLLSAMLQDWTGMINFFQEIQQETVDLDDVPCLVSGLSGKLKDKQFVFLVVLFRHLFQITDTLYQELRSHPFDPVFCQGRVKYVCVTLYRKRNDNCYKTIFIQAEQIMRECSGSDDSTPPAEDDDDDDSYKPLFYEILDNLIMELHTRFENTDQHTYFHIGNLLHNDANREFVRERVRVAMDYFPNIFTDSKELERQLSLLSHHRSHAKTPLLNVIYRLRGAKQSNFAEAYKLMSLIVLQTPSTQKFPCLHEFSGYLKDSDAGLRPHLASILMNKDILNVLSSRYSFKDDVLNKLSVKIDAVKLSHMVKSLEKRPEAVLGTEPNLVLGLEPNSLMTTVTPSDMVVELDPTSIISSAPGPSIRMEPDSSMMEQDVHLAMTCEVYPADDPQPDSQIKIKQEPIDPDSYKQDILSASVMQELRHFSKEGPLTNNQDGSLFQPPVLIKEEPVSSEEEL